MITIESFDGAKTVNATFYNFKSIDEARIAHLFNVIFKVNFTQLKKRFPSEQAVAASLMLRSFSLKRKLFCDLRCRAKMILECGNFKLIKLLPLEGLLLNL